MSGNLRSGPALKQFTINLQFVIDGKIVGTGLGIATVPETTIGLAERNRRRAGDTLVSEMLSSPTPLHVQRSRDQFSRAKR